MTRTPRLIAWISAAVLGAPLATAQDPEPFVVGGDGLYSLPRSQDEIAEWQRALAEIRDNRFEPAVERLNRLLRRASQGVVPSVGEVDRWIGLRMAVLHTLRDLPPDGRAIYDRLARLEAGAIYDAAPHTLSKEQLSHLAERFPTAAAGIRARIRLADLALEAGDGILAQQHLRAARDATPQVGDVHRALLARAEAARMLVLSSAGAALPEDGEMVEAVSAAVPGGAVGGWPAYGGGLDGSRQMTPPIGVPDEGWRQPVRAERFDINDFPMHAVGDLSGILVNDGHSVHCFDPLRAEVAWMAPGPMIDSGEVTAVNPDMMLACAASADVVVAALEVPVDVIGAARTQHFRNTISIIEKIPARRLFAFDRTSGKRLWAHFDSEDGPITERFRGHDACGVPVVHGDTVYVASHDQAGAIAFYLSAYDLHTGEPRWRRLICTSQQEVNMFGNARQEFAAGPIALIDGTVIGTTNLGVCFSVDADDGRIRWITGYPTIPLPRTQLRDQERRPVFFANNPIVVADGVMATTPLDSEYALGIDTHTGAIEWMQPFEVNGRSSATIRWLLGAIGEQFVFAGLGIVTIEAHGEGGRPQIRFVASATELGEDHYRVNAIPRGAIAGDRIYYLGSAGALRILSLSGTRDPRMADLRIAGRGNLLLVDGLSVYLRNGEIEIHSDLEALVRDARGAVDADPDDPVALLRLATLERALLGRDVDGAAAERVEEIYAAGLRAARQRGLGSGSRVHGELAQGLFRISLERALRSAEDAPDRAVSLLERARERAVQPSQWLRAQQEIIDLSAGDPVKVRAELERMARQHGRETYVFRGVGRVPVSVYALVRSLPYVADPAEAAERSQLLIDRHGDVEFGGRTVREIAVEHLESILRRHGREAYASIEARAQDLLENASDDPALLRRVVDRFPHSEAAARATRQLLEHAVASGDLRVAATAFRDAAERGALSAGVLRRMMASAASGGNLPLAHALGSRLVGSHGAETSDYAPDGGATYRELVAALPPLPERDVARPELPVDSLGAVSAPVPMSTVEVLAAPGFAVDGKLPLCVAIDGRELLVFDLDEGAPTSVADAASSLPLDGLANAPLLLCGDVLVVFEEERVRGIDLSAGIPAWTYEVARNWGLTEFYGVTEGVLHVYAVDRSGGDSARLLVGIEPRTGAVLFEFEPPGWRNGAEPVRSADAFWQFEAKSDGDGPVIREIDPILGSIASTTPLRPDVLETLGLVREASVRIFESNVQNKFTADDRALFVPVDSNGDSSLQLVAIARESGEQLWSWTGATGSYAHRLGRADDVLVVFERAGAGGGARLVLLDAETGRERRAHVFGEQAVVTNWPAPPRDDRVPSTLLISDRAQAAQLSCVSLDESGPNFRYPLPNVSRIAQEPILGDDFLLIPAWRQGRSQPLIKVVDLATRRGALPNGSDTLTLDVSRPITVQPHDGFLVVTSPEGVRLLGARRR